MVRTSSQIDRVERRFDCRWIRAATLCALVAVLAAGVVASVPEVTIAQGRVLGTHPAAGVDRFAGIPYAIPPTGDRRFARSIVNSEPFVGGRLRAIFPGAPCIQNPLGDPRPPTDPEAPPPAEDCLTLNIWRPSEAVGSRGYNHIKPSPRATVLSPDQPTTLLSISD